jgi:hypothetical protein
MASRTLMIFVKNTPVRRSMRDVLARLSKLKAGMKVMMEAKNRHRIVNILDPTFELDSYG